MVRSLFIVIAAVWTSLSISGQDILHYKFESGGGSTVINYGDPTPGVPRLAQIVPDDTTPVASAWGAGKFGGGLAGGPVNHFNGYELNTGWDNVVTTGQAVTIAFFFTVMHPPASGDSVYFCRPAGNGEGIRMNISAGATTFGRVSMNWQGGGNGVTRNLNQDCLTPAFSGWVHVAVVITRSGPLSCQSGTAQWYVNGVAQLPTAPSGCWHNIEGSSLEPFTIAEIDESYFRYDDWRVSLRAVPAAEIMQWATADLADHAPFGDACHPFGLSVLLWGSGGNPISGNGAYAMTVYGLPGSAVWLGFGLSSTSFLGTPLPADLGAIIPSLAGCQLRASAEFGVTGTIGAAGSLTIPTPIPPASVGLNAYAQAVLYSSVLGAWSSTNAWAVHVGN
jgi:hypothetical protein